MRSALTQYCFWFPGAPGRPLLGVFGKSSGEDDVNLWRSTSANPFKWLQKRAWDTLISEAPRSGPLSLAPVSAKALKKRASQGVL